MIHNKLVRDKIPEIIERQGQHADTRLLSEAGEFHKEKNLEELADILEVVYALAENLGCTKEELLQVYRNKHEKRGGFRERIYLISVSDKL